MTLLQGQIDQLKATVYSQNEDIRIYKHNEGMLKSELMHPKPLKPEVLASQESLEALPKYEPLFHPEVIPQLPAAESEVERVVPSPVKQEELQREIQKAKKTERPAGIKSKKDYPINWIFGE